MIRHTLARLITGTVMVAGMGASATVTAFAAAAAATSQIAATPKAVATVNPGDLVAIKSRCNDAVQKRLGTLGADAQFVQQAAALTGPDRSTLIGQIDADTTGLTALDTTIQADTTLKQAHSDCALIVSAYRVYVLEEPKIHEVIGADGITAVDGSFTTLEPQLQALIANSTAPPANRAAAQAALNDLEGKVTASRTSISGVGASVIALLPSGYPGNDVVLQSAAQNIATARADLRGARADVDTVLHQLGK